MLELPNCNELVFEFLSECVCGWPLWWMWLFVCGIEINRSTYQITISNVESYVCRLLSISHIACFNHNFQFWLGVCAYGICATKRNTRVNIWNWNGTGWLMVYYIIQSICSDCESDTGKRRCSHQYRIWAKHNLLIQPSIRSTIIYMHTVVPTKSTTLSIYDDHFIKLYQLHKRAVHLHNSESSTAAGNTHTHIRYFWQ